MSKNTPTPPENPDGSPVLTTPSVGVVGTANIYDWILPKQLDPNKKTIWYDIRHGTKTTPNNDGAAYGPPPAGILPGATQSVPGTTPSPMPTGAASRERTTATSTDRMVTPKQIMNTIGAMQYSDPKGFLAIQTYLSSGVWGTVHVNGTFDHETEVALGNAMLQWSKLTRNTEMPVDFKQYLSQAGSQALSLKGVSSGNPSGSPISLSDPNAIRQAAQSAAMDAIGSGLSDAQLNQFVSKFQAEQVKYQMAATGTQATAPDLSGEAAAFAQQSDPHGYQQNQRQAYLDALVNLLQPEGPSRPNIPITPKA